MADPVTIVGLAITATLAMGSAAISYGASRQKVSDLSDRVTGQDAKLKEMAEAVTKMSETKGAVETLGETIKSFGERAQAGQDLVLTKLDGFDRLFSERLDNLKERIDGRVRPAATRQSRSSRS